jgi:predicted kinase
MYARGAPLHLDTPLFQPPGSQVTVLSGLPASGKDTWVARHAAGREVVSFDDAKAELGLKHGDNDGLAAHRAVDKAKALLRRHEPFVWNATHLSDQMRGKTLDLLLAYDAQVRLVYLEVPCDTLFRRNAARDTTLRQKDLERMLHRWEVPQPWEAHDVRYETGLPTAKR